MQALINFRDNINILDSLCGVLLPNMNLIIVCEPEVNLWAFKGVACKLWHCCLFRAPQTTHLQSACQPGMVALTALLGSGMADVYCQIYVNPVRSQTNDTKWNQVKSAHFKISRYDDGSPPSSVKFIALVIPAVCRARVWLIIPPGICCASRGTGYAHTFLCVDAKAREDKLPVFPAKQKLSCMFLNN